MYKFNNRDILMQINRHIPIDGYRIFSEEKSRKRYTIVLLSGDCKKCVLAEIENMADPKGIIKIIEF